MIKFKKLAVAASMAAALASANASANWNQVFDMGWTCSGGLQRYTLSWDHTWSSGLFYNVGHGKKASVSNTNGWRNALLKSTGGYRWFSLAKSCTSVGSGSSTRPYYRVRGCATVYANQDPWITPYNSTFCYDNWPRDYPLSQRTSNNYAIFVPAPCSGPSV
jgi:hypothetical protein